MACVVCVSSVRPPVNRLQVIVAKPKGKYRCVHFVALSLPFINLFCFCLCQFEGVFFVFYADNDDNAAADCARLSLHRLQVIVTKPKGKYRCVHL